MIDLTSYGFKIEARAPAIEPLDVGSKGFTSAADLAALAAWKKVFVTEGHLMSPQMVNDCRVVGADLLKSNGQFMPTLTMTFGANGAMHATARAWCPYQKDLALEASSTSRPFNPSTLKKVVIEAAVEAAKGLAEKLKARADSIMQGLHEQVEIGRSYDKYRAEAARRSLIAFNHLMKLSPNKVEARAPQVAGRIVLNDAWFEAHFGKDVASPHANKTAALYEANGCMVEVSFWSDLDETMPKRGLSVDADEDLHARVWVNHSIFSFNRELKAKAGSIVNAVKSLIADLCNKAKESTKSVVERKFMINGEEAKVKRAAYPSIEFDTRLYAVLVGLATDGWRMSLYDKKDARLIRFQKAHDLVHDFYGPLEKLLGTSVGLKD